MRDKDYTMERQFYAGSKGTWLTESIQMKIPKNDIAVRKYPERE